MLVPCLSIVVFQRLRLFPKPVPRSACTAPGPGGAPLCANPPCRAGRLPRLGQGGQLLVRTRVAVPPDSGRTQAWRSSSLTCSDAWLASSAHGMSPSAAISPRRGAVPEGPGLRLERFLTGRGRILGGQPAFPMLATCCSIFWNILVLFLVLTGMMRSLRKSIFYSSMIRLNGASGNAEDKA